MAQITFCNLIPSDPFKYEILPRLGPYILIIEQVNTSLRENAAVRHIASKMTDYEICRNFCLIAEEYLIRGKKAAALYQLRRFYWKFGLSYSFIYKMAIAADLPLLFSYFDTNFLNILDKFGDIQWKRPHGCDLFKKYTDFILDEDFNNMLLKMVFAHDAINIFKILEPVYNERNERVEKKTSEEKALEAAGVVYSKIEIGSSEKKILYKDYNIPYFRKDCIKVLWKNDSLKIIKYLSSSNKEFRRRIIISPMCTFVSEDETRHHDYLTKMSYESFKYYRSIITRKTFNDPQHMLKFYNNCLKKISGSSKKVPETLHEKRDVYLRNVINEFIEFGFEFDETASVINSIIYNMIQNDYWRSLERSAAYITAETLLTDKLNLFNSRKELILTRFCSYEIFKIIVSILTKANVDLKYTSNEFQHRREDKFKYIKDRVIYEDDKFYERAEPHLLTEIVESAVVSGNIESFRRLVSNRKFMEAIPVEKRSITFVFNNSKSSNDTILKAKIYEELWPECCGRASPFLHTSMLINAFILTTQRKVYSGDKVYNIDRGEVLHGISFIQKYDSEYLLNNSDNFNGIYELYKIGLYVRQKDVDKMIDEAEHRGEIHKIADFLKWYNGSLKW